MGVDPTGLPTDNLYKFLALAGLGATGFCLWFWWTRRNLLLTERMDIDRELARAESRLDRSERLLADHVKAQHATRAARDALEGDVAKFLAEKPPDAAVEHFRVHLQARAKEISEQQDRDFAAVARSEVLVFDNKEALRDLETRAKAHVQQRNDVAWLGTWMLAAASVGLIISAAGFYLWYVRVQWFIDKQTRADFEDHMAELAEKSAARQKAHKP